MRNDGFFSTGSSLDSSKKDVASPFDDILRSNKPKVQRGFSHLQPLKLQKAQTEGSTSVLGSTPLTDKWQSFPSCQKTTLNHRSSMMTQSMPVLKPVRKKSNEDFFGETRLSVEGVGDMRNATFSSPRGGPSLGRPSSMVASPFDAILRGDNKKKKKPSQQQQQQQQASNNNNKKKEQLCSPPDFQTTLLEAKAIEMMHSTKGSGVVRTATKDTMADKFFGRSASNGSRSLNRGRRHLVRSFS